MLKYIYGVAAVIVLYLALLLLQVWQLISISAENWAKLTVTFVIIGSIILVLLGVRYVKHDDHINKDGNSLIS